MDGVLLVLAMLGAFGAGVVATLLWQNVLSERRARAIDQLVRDAADADPEHGLGM